MIKGIAKAGGVEWMEDRNGVLLALSRLSKTVATDDAESAFLAAAEIGSVLLHVSRVVVLIKEEDGTLSVGASIGFDSDSGIISIAKELAQASLESHTPIVYPDSGTAPARIERELAQANLESALCVPMRVGEASVGAVVALSDTPRSFSPSDTEILHVVASQAALAAWRASSQVTHQSNGSQKQADLIRLANRKIQELLLVNQVSEAVNSTLDLDKVLDIALEQSMMAVGADGGSLMLSSEETNRLEIAVSRGLARKWVENTAQQVGKSIAGWVAEHGESVLVSNARKDSRFNMSFFRDNLTSAASIPLKTKAGVIGVLNVNTVQPEKIFDERDLEFLGTVANQMAVAIENARLYARVNRRTKQLSSLLQMSKTITSTLNQDEVLKRLTGEICDLFQLEVCVVLLLDELSQRFRFGYGVGLRTRRKYAYFDLAAPIAARVKSNGQKLIIRDINTSAQLRTEISQSEKLKSVICLPFKNQGKLVGLAVGFTRDSRAFKKSQLDIMRPLGELAGVAISNARIYRQKYRIARMLQERLVPSSIPQLPKLDIGHKYLPAREVGGDYYDFIPLGENRIGVVMGDVAGSDVEAAEFTTMGKHILRTYAREYQSPAAVLQKTNDQVCEDTHAETFISVFYGIIDLNSMQLCHSNAGCEPALLYKAKDKTVSLLKTDGILLGVSRGISYGEQHIGLEPGDVLAAFTDGLTEAPFEGKRFGAKTAIQVIQDNAHLDAQGIADAIHDALLTFVHGRVADDVAMIVLKIG